MTSLFSKSLCDSQYERFVRRYGTGSVSDLSFDHEASRAALRSLTPLVTPQITFNQIPPAAAGGSFNPDLQDTENTLESHRRQPVDCSFPTCALNNGKQRLGMNNPPAAAGGIVGIFLVLGRLGMNNPPAAAGGIYKASACARTNERRRRLISGVSTAENASLDL